LVIDASITLSWLLPDEHTGQTLAVRGRMLALNTVWVPLHWRLEICNSLWMAERRMRLDVGGVARALSLLAQLPATIDPETNDHAGSETLNLSRKHSLSIYDAAHLELALRRGASLGSLDVPLRSVARELGVPTLPDKLPGES
jgi:predicted nucleic acid-binding protein